MGRRLLGIGLAGLGLFALAAGLWMARPPIGSDEGQLLPDVGGPVALATATASSARRSALRSAGLVTALGRVLPERVSLVLLTNDKRAFSIRGVGARAVRFVEVANASALTIWPQDPFLVIEQSVGPPALLASRDFGRANDEAMPRALHEQMGFELRTSRLHFEGGNIVSDETTIFVGADTIARNVVELGMSPEAVARQLEYELGRPVLVLGPSPQAVPHLDMAVTPLGEGRVLVGDPEWGAQVADDMLRASPQHVVSFEQNATADFFGHPEIETLEEPDGSTLEAPNLLGSTRLAVIHSRHIAEHLHGVAEALAARGFEVSRVPLLLPAPDPAPEPAAGFPALTYNNVLIEQAAGLSRVYLPRYGLTGLDEAAAEAWQALGFEVVAVDGLVTSALYGGSLRCSLKVLGRDPPGDGPPSNALR